MKYFKHKNGIKTVLSACPIIFKVSQSCLKRIWIGGPVPSCHPELVEGGVEGPVPSPDSVGTEESFRPTPLYCHFDPTWSSSSTEQGEVRIEMQAERNPVFIILPWYIIGSVTCFNA